MRRVSRSLLGLVALSFVAACSGDDESPAAAPSPSGNDAGTPAETTPGGEGDEGGDAGGNDETKPAPEVPFNPATDCEAIDAAAFSAAATLDLSKSCYYAAANLVTNASVTIQPGVEIYLAKDVSIDFAQSLTAVGTAAAPIVFAAAKESEPFGSVRVHRQGEIVHASFTGGGAGDSEVAGMLDFRAGDAARGELKQITFDKGHNESCLYVESSFATLEGLKIDDCSAAKVLISVPADLLDSLEETTHDLGAGKVRVRGGKFYEDVSFTKKAYTYQVTGELEVDGTLNVDPGVEIEVDSRGFFGVTGQGRSLHMVGTAAEPIVIKGVTSPGWRGIRVTSRASGTISYVNVSGGSSAPGSSDPGSNIRVEGVASATVTNCTISNAGYGIVKTSNSSLSQSNNTFQNITYQNVMSY